MIGNFEYDNFECNNAVRAFALSDTVEKYCKNGRTILEVVTQLKAFEYNCKYLFINTNSYFFASSESDKIKELGLYTLVQLVHVINMVDFKYTHKMYEIIKYIVENNLIKGFSFDFKYNAFMLYKSDMLVTTRI